MTKLEYNMLEEKLKKTLSLVGFEPQSGQRQASLTEIDRFLKKKERER